jgi:enamine deaminase RidA (YjgF/YER057c/UK114 family)
LTLDCPLFRRGRIVVDESEVVVAVADSLAPVAWMRVVKFHVEKKDVGTDGLVEVIQVPDAYGGAEEEEADGVPDVQERDHDIVVEVPARSGDTTAQTFHAHCNTSDGFDAMLYALRRGMHEHGWCMDTDCVFVTLFVDDMARFGAVNEVYSRHFPPVNPPSRATLEKSTRGISIQVLCSSRPRSVLHVQSLSRWAPSCIGPYSQAVACDGLVRYSGQIALEPETLTIACNDLDAEVARVSRTCDLLGQAMKLDWASTVLWSVLYVSDRFPTDVLRRLLNRHEDESEDVEEDIGDSNAYDDHGTSYIEEYLKGTKNDKVVVRPEVMTLIVECPCLPRNARIEIQSVHAGIESLTYMDPDSSSDEEEQTAQLAAMAEYGWLRHLTYDESSTPIFRIRAAYAPGKLAKIHMISLVSESDALKEGTVGGGDLMDAIAPILQAAAFTTADITSVNGYVAGAGREILQDTLHAALGVPAFVVQVSGVALFGQGQGEENSPARFAIELLFSK